MTGNKTKCRRVVRTKKNTAAAHLGKKKKTLDRLLQLHLHFAQTSDAHFVCSSCFLPSSVRALRAYGRLPKIPFSVPDGS